jgi:peptidase M28-like protein
MKTFLNRQSKPIVITIWALCLIIILSGKPWQLAAQAPQPAAGVKYAQVASDDLKEWLTYLSSDELQGRQVFTEGYGLAAQYIAEHLKQWGVKPLNPDGSYFQPVKLKGYRVTRNSSVTVDINGKQTTFKHGDHVTFSVNSGGKQTVAFNGVEFVGYGQQSDYAGRDVKGKLVLVVPNLAPNAAGVGNRGGARGGGGGFTASGAAALITLAPASTQGPAEQALAQAQAALAQANAAVVQAQQALRGGGGRGFGGGGRGGAPATPPDLTTVQRVDGIVTPQFTADETFFETVFGDAAKFADIKAKAQKGDPLQATSIAAKVTVNIDNTYEVISEQLSHNVVGMVPGTDPVLKDTYVMFGAHLDHIGYSQTGNGRGGDPSGCRRRSTEAQAAVVAAGKIVQRPSDPAAGGARGGGARGGAPAANPVPFDQRDIINNGADDDGSGSASLLGVAKAFAAGPKPKRSIVFVWHTGEEAGLYGSRYNADFPMVPTDRVQVQLNMDMVGRDDCDNIEGDFTNTVFVVGADRISTDLHNLIVETNGTKQKPLTLDYELNDPSDPEGVYTRSDHYSYAAKGIPIAFFTTGLHPDYHRVTDTVDKITFPKMTRIAQLVYETGFSIANTERLLERDNRGPRTGFGTKAEVLKKQ